MIGVKRMSEDRLEKQEWNFRRTGGGTEHLTIYEMCSFTALTGQAAQ